MLGLAIVVGLDHLDLQIGPPRSVERRVRIVVVEIEDLASGYLIILGKLLCAVKSYVNYEPRKDLVFYV